MNATTPSRTLIALRNCSKRGQSQSVVGALDVDDVSRREKLASIFVTRPMSFQRQRTMEAKAAKPKPCVLRIAPVSADATPMPNVWKAVDQFRKRAVHWRAQLIETHLPPALRQQRSLNSRLTLRRSGGVLKEAH